MFAGSAVALGLIDLTRRLLVGRGRGTWIDDVCVVGFFGSVAFFVTVVFGEPVKRARVGSFEVLIWDHDTQAQVQPMVIR